MTSWKSDFLALPYDTTLQAEINMIKLYGKVLLEICSRNLRADYSNFP